MTPREIALLICEPWFNGDPCEGCECHKVCTKLVERIEAAIQAERAPETNFGNMAQAVDSKESDHIRDATEIVASVREDRTDEPVAWAVITKSGKLYKAASTKKSAERKAQQQIDKLGAEWECSVVPLYTAPPKREPLTDEEIESLADEFLDWNSAGIESFVRAVERAHGIGGEE